ncbi:GNAT family N-acetyltransferase [Nocardioides sp.]|uniref:GNAT family N-acetyltransferase n=1 Tax=Nocardioides sp. TaxID=35761 RepID=UPI002ED083BE
MSLPERIVTQRLRLILVTPDDAADMRAGRRQERWHPSYPRPDDVDAASLLRPDDPWGPRHVVLEQQAVGTIGCFGPPEDGETEIGFGLVSEARGQRVATEALTAYAEETDRLGVRLTARVEPDNAPSLKVLARCGFTELRGSTPEGELVLARPVP